MPLRAHSLDGRRVESNASIRASASCTSTGSSSLGVMRAIASRASRNLRALPKPRPQLSPRDATKRDHEGSLRARADGSCARARSSRGKRTYHVPIAKVPTRAVRDPLSPARARALQRARPQLVRLLFLGPEPRRSPRTTLSRSVVTVGVACLPEEDRLATSATCGDGDFKGHAHARPAGRRPSHPSSHRSSYLAAHRAVPRQDAARCG